MSSPSSKVKLLAAKNSNNKNGENHKKASLIFDLYSESSISYKHTLLVLLPYILSKVAIAVNNSYLQYLFGQINNNHDVNNNNYDSNNSTNNNNNNSILDAEATIFQFEFLIMGLCMGGLRAVSVMAGQYCSKIYVRYLDLEVEYEVEKSQRQARRQEIARKREAGEPIDVNDFESEDFYEEEENSSSSDDDDVDGSATTRRWKYKNSVLFRGHLRRRVFYSVSDQQRDEQQEQQDHCENKKKKKKRFRAPIEFSPADIGLCVPPTNQHQLGKNHNENDKNQESDSSLYKLDEDDRNNLISHDYHQSGKLQDFGATGASPSPPSIHQQQKHFPSSSSSSPHYKRTNSMRSVGGRSERSVMSNKYNVKNCHIPSLVELRLFVKLRSVFVSSFLITTIYGIIATLLFVFAKDIFTGFKIIDDDDNKEILDHIHSYSSGFAIGVLPTLWLYATEQFLLGCHASGTVLVYGVFYAGISSLFVFLFSSPASPIFPVQLLSSSFSSPLFGMGLGMSIGAWISFIAIHLHLTFLDREIFRDLCTVFAVAHCLHERYSHDRNSWNPDWRASWETVKGTTRRFLGLSSMMGLSNLVGLVSGLLVAVATTSSSPKNDSDDQNSEMYSIASAYYQTLAIAVLGASSAVSALVASTNGIAKHFKDKFLTLTQENVDREQLGELYDKIYSSSKNDKTKADEENTSLLINSSTKEMQLHQERAPKLTTIISRSLFIMFIFALLLAIPPLVTPDPFIEFFGGEISNFNTTFSTFKGTEDANGNHQNEIYQFIVPSFLSFVMMTLAMCVSASLHALFDVVLPLVFHLVSYTLGGVWIVVFANKYNKQISKDETDENSNNHWLIVSSYGSVIGPTLYLLMLSAWLLKRYLCV